MTRIAFATHLLAALYGALLTLKAVGWLHLSWWLVLAPIWAVAVPVGAFLILLWLLYRPGSGGAGGWM